MSLQLTVHGPSCKCSNYVILIVIIIYIYIYIAGLFYLLMYHSLMYCAIYIYSKLPVKVTVEPVLIAQFNYCVHPFLAILRI